MNIDNYLALTLLAAGGEIQGTTKLQKTVYFAGALSGDLDELGYSAHFYGPYSSEVANALGRLRTIGALDRNTVYSGDDSFGYESWRCDYRLNQPGRPFAESVARREPALWQRIRPAVETCVRCVDISYMDLCVAAKVFYLLGEQCRKSSIREVQRLSAGFGWNIGRDDAYRAATYLRRIGVFELADETMGVPFDPTEMLGASAISIDRP